MDWPPMPSRHRAKPQMPSAMRWSPAWWRSTAPWSRPQRRRSVESRRVATAAKAASKGCRPIRRPSSFPRLDGAAMTLRVSGSQVQGASPMKKPFDTSRQLTRLDRRTALSLLFSLPFAAPAFAQSYPDRPIRMIVPFAPAGITDVSARLVAQQMSVSLGQSIVVENRAGGGGSIGTTAVARADPDGYTLLVASSATNAILPAMHDRLDFDPIKSFVPIAKISTAP